MRTSLSSRGYRVTRAYCVTVVHRTAPGLVSNQCGKSVPPPAKLMRSGVLARMMTDPPRLLVERSGTKVRVALMVLCVGVYCQCNRLWGPRTSMKVRHSDKGQKVVEEITVESIRITVGKRT